MNYLDEMHATARLLPVAAAKAHVIQLKTEQVIARYHQVM
jgi:hypothetical protein